MRKMKSWIVKGAMIASAVWGLTAAQALTMDEARGIAIGDTTARVEALAKAVAQGDEKTAAYLQALADDVVKIAKDKVLVVRDGQGLDPVTGQALAVPPDAEDVMLNNRLRGELDTALAALKLFSPDLKVRRLAALSLLKEPDARRAPLLNKALAAEQDETVKSLVRQALAAALLSSEAPNDRLLAAQELAGSQQPETMLLLNGRLSRANALALVDKLKRVAREFSAQHIEDASLPLVERPPISILLACRPWQPAGKDRSLRVPCPFVEDVPILILRAALQLCKGC
jgi:urea transport system permease protein